MKKRRDQAFLRESLMFLGTATAFGSIPGIITKDLMPWQYRLLWSIIAIGFVMMGASALLIWYDYRSTPEGSRLAKLIKEGVSPQVGKTFDEKKRSKNNNG